MENYFCPIVDMLPEPILVVTSEGKIIKANQAAQKFFSAYSSTCLKGAFLSNFLSVDVKHLLRWLKIWRRSSSMTPGCLSLVGNNGTVVKVGLEAAAIPQRNQDPLVLIRLQKDQAVSMISKFIALKQRVITLDQELAKYKISESKLRQEYQHLLYETSRLHSLANQDGLTGISNRRSFDQRLQHYWLEGERNKSPLGIILLDIDYFKLYNDTYGHVQGDHCLKQVSQTINREVRQEVDVVARYGGEEFGVLLKAGEEIIFTVATRILAAIRNLKIPHALSPQGIVTLSAGVGSMVPSSSYTAVDLVNIADKALYEAKQEGRDRVVVGYHLITMADRVFLRKKH